MPDDTTHSLADLARLADVTPRTIRYYLAQGLLPPPEPAGPATRYGEGHLARLRLIKRLQRDHLPLAEIRLRLERMGDDEVVATVSALESRQPEPSRDPGDTLAFVRSLMQRSGVRPSIAGSRAGIRLGLRVSDGVEQAYGTPPAPAAPRSATQAAAASGSPPSSPPSPAPSASPTASPAPAVAGAASELEPMRPSMRSTWERLVITPDVELHVRRPLDRHANKRVDQLERIARDLFDDAT